MDSESDNTPSKARSFLRKGSRQEPSALQRIKRDGLSTPSPSNRGDNESQKPSPLTAGNKSSPLLEMRGGLLDTTTITLTDWSKGFGNVKCDSPLAAQKYVVDAVGVAPLLSMKQKEIAEFEQLERMIGNDLSRSTKPPANKESTNTGDDRSFGSSSNMSKLRSSWESVTSPRNSFDSKVNKDTLKSASYWGSAATRGSDSEEEDVMMSTTATSAPTRKNEVRHSTARPALYDDINYASYPSGGLNGTGKRPAAQSPMPAPPLSATAVKTSNSASFSSTGEVKVELSAKAKELNDLLILYERDTSELKSLKEQHAAMLEDAKRIREEALQFAADEKIRISKLEAETKAQLIRERRTLLKELKDEKEKLNGLGASAVPITRKERSEIDALKASVEAIKVERDGLVNKFKTNEKRMQSLIKKQQGDNDILQKQILQLEKEKIELYSYLNECHITLPKRFALKPPSSLNSTVSISRKSTGVKDTKLKSGSYVEVVPIEDTPVPPVLKYHVGDDGVEVPVEEWDLEGEYEGGYDDEYADQEHRVDAAVDDSISSLIKPMNTQQEFKHYKGRYSDMDASEKTSDFSLSKSLFSQASQVNSASSVKAISTLPEPVITAGPAVANAVTSATTAVPSATSGHVDGRLDGSNRVSETRADDGRVIVTYRNGTVKETFPDRRQIVRFANGDIKRMIPVDTPTSSNPTSTGGVDQHNIVIYYYHDSSTTHTTYPDGRQIFEFASGQVEKHMPDGSKHVTFPDGVTKKIVYANGVEEGYFPDGTVVREFQGKREIIRKGNKVT